MTMLQEPEETAHVKLSACVLTVATTHASFEPKHNTMQLHLVSTLSFARSTLKYPPPPHQTTKRAKWRGTTNRTEL